METKTLTFTREKETKNTIRYAEDLTEGQPTVVGTLYLQKWFAGDAQRLLVTITEVK